ncbi:CD226 antigen isoform X2 [Paramormyrops kingsleyae]|uniref:CD226 antigen isoform X2 n=1 Tax=Paramormyrops kingsleyae TaxID=1676925 RepID=UPI000CD624F0|nr:CD226 antigen isoform X2 [Paramormyrops kingsleyae]
MDALKKDYWYSMVHIIFLSLLTVVHLLMAQGLVVKLEEGMTLDCICPWSGNFTMVSWKRELRTFAVYHPIHGMNISSGYTGRVKFLKSSPMDGSISLRNVTERDVGQYHCSIQSFPLGSWTNNVFVKKAVDFDESKVDTSIRVKKGGNVTISCNHLSNRTLQHVVFEMVRGRKVQTMAQCQSLAGSSLKAISYKDLAHVSCNSILNASLQLTNVTEEDGGLYRCLFDMEVVGQTTLLTVSEGGGNLTVQHMIYIGAGAAGLVLVSLVVIAVMFFWHRKKRRAKVRVKSHPLQRSLLNNYEPSGVPKKMKKRTKRQDPIYCNIMTQPRQTKRKT